MKKNESNTYNRTILILIAIGVWFLVLQNMGVMVGSRKVKLDEPIRVKGDMEVKNTVDVNVSKVLGRPVGSSRSYELDGVEYHTIHVSPR